MTEVTLSMPPWSCNPRITNSIFIDEYRLFFCKVNIFSQDKTLSGKRVRHCLHKQLRSIFGQITDETQRANHIRACSFVSVFFSICLLLLFDYKYGVGTAFVGKFVEDFTVFPHLRSVIRALLFFSCYIYITVVYYYG